MTTANHERPAEPRLTRTRSSPSAAPSSPRCARRATPIPTTSARERSCRPTCTRRTTTASRTRRSERASRCSVKVAGPHDAEARDGQGELRDDPGHERAASSSTSRRRCRRSSARRVQALGPRRHRRREGTLFKTRTGELSVKASDDAAAGQVAAAAAGEVPRPDRPGAEVPPALRRPDHQPGIARRVRASARRSCRRSASSSSRAAISKSRRR